MNRARIKKIFFMTLAVTAALSLTGCSTFDSFKHTFIDENTKSSDDVIYIGTYEPQSGELKQEGNDELKGIELAHDIYSNVKGADVQLVSVDTQSDTDSSKTAIKDLIKMNPTVIIGSAGEASSIIAGAYIMDAKIPTITPSATNPMITDKNKYYFRACITDSQMGAGLAEYAYSELQSTKIGIITIKNDSTVAAVADGFKERLNTLATKASPIVMEKSIAVDDKNMNKLVKKIKKSDANVIFLPVGAEKADSIFKKVEQAGLTNITFLGTKDWNGDEFAVMMKKHPDIKVAFPSDTVVQANSSTTTSVTAETQKFLIEYANKYGEDDVPSEHAVQGYDAYLLAINAINNAKSLNRDDVRDALASIKDLRCATGVFTFDNNGNPVRSVNISTVKNGKILSAYVTSSKLKAGTVKKIEK